MRRVLVTGGCGFGGSHLVARLVRDGARVTVLDLVDYTSAQQAQFPELSQAGVHRGDVRDLARLTALLRDRQCDTVFHLAAQALVPLSIDRPFETLEVNARGTYAVLEACRRIGVEALVVASSGAYYGTTTTDQPVPETAAPQPSANLYASSKAAADLAAQGYAHTFGMPVAVCRFMNTYGPGDANLSRLVPRCLALLASGAALDFGDRDDGTTRLDFLHVRDMTEAYLRVARYVVAKGGLDAVFNIGTGHATAIADVARTLSVLFDGATRPTIFRGEPRRIRTVKYLDVAKARDLLGWESSVSLEAGLSELASELRSRSGP